MFKGGIYRNNVVQEGSKPAMSPHMAAVAVPLCINVRFSQLFVGRERGLIHISALQTDFRFPYQDFGVYKH